VRETHPDPGSRAAGGSRFGRTARGWRALLVALLLVAAAGPRPVRAQAPDLAGRPITGIEIQGLRALSEETLRYYLGLEVGQPFDPAVLDDKIHDLWERDLIDDVTVEALPASGGVQLTLRITERPVLRSIEYEGLKKLSRTDIQERMDREQISLREGAPIDLGELARLKAALLDLYREKGFRFAQVEHSFEEVSPGERRLRFTVDEGDRVKIQRIGFEGNTVFSDWRLRQQMRKTRESGPLSRLFKRDIYNPATVQEDLTKVRDIYRAKGYKNAVVGEPEIEVIARNPDAPTPRKQKRRLVLNIPIVEGERWRFGEIAIEGNEVFPDEILLRAFNRPRGEWLRSESIDKAVEAVSELYRNGGYLYSQVDVELQERPNNVADVVIRVFEGDRFTVGRMEFEGNDRTRDKVLRREFRVQEGMVLNMGALRNSLLKIRQLEYFTLDEEDPIEFTNIDRENKTVDLLVKGEESDRTELLFGGGWSELDGFFGQFSMQTRNFLGRGETLGVSLQSGSVRDIFELSYFVPWLLDRPQSAGFQLFKRDLDYDLINTQRQILDETGGVLTYGRSYGLFNSVRFSYGYNDVVSRNEFVSSQGQPVVSTFVYEKSFVRPSWIYDSTDSRIEPTRGLRALGEFEYAGGGLGGDIELVRPEITFTFFRPLQQRPIRTVFGFNLEAGWLDEFGDAALPPNERYFIGGARSLRGHTARSIWLRNEDDVPVFDEFGNIRGGNSFVEAGLEYHVLLGGPFRLVFFVDGGNVYGEGGRKFDVEELRATAGAELRLFVPVFGLPLRFIYAENLTPLPDDRFESFQFDVGLSF
jgi:outer membrane protein insertion porin family